MSCLKKFCNYFNTFTLELKEYLPTEIQSLINYEDEYTNEELEELDSVKINLQDDIEEDTLGFELV